MGYVRVWDPWESQTQRKFTPLTYSPLQTFTGFSEKRLDLCPGDFLGDPDPPPLHNNHFLLLSLLSPGQESIMPLPQWQNTSKNLGSDHYLTLPQGNRVLSLFKTEAGPGQHRIPTGTHHQASKHEYQVIEEYCWGGARVYQENPPEVQVPWEGSKLQMEQEYILKKILETQPLP